MIDHSEYSYTPSYELGNVYVCLSGYMFTHRTTDPRHNVVCYFRVKRARLRVVLTVRACVLSLIYGNLAVPGNLLSIYLSDEWSNIRVY
jgi:hypothetical protein